MPAIASWIIEPIWTQFVELLPNRKDTHPLGCHNPRIPERVVLDKLVQVLERRTPVIDFWLAFSAVIITVRRLVREGWTRYRWEGRPCRRP